VDRVFGTPEAKPLLIEMATFDPENAARTGKRDLTLGLAVCGRNDNAPRKSAFRELHSVKGCGFPKPRFSEAHSKSGQEAFRRP
jgi:hypothetical protein